MKYRQEKDSLGTIDVPQHVRYGAQTQRALVNFSYAPHPFPKIFIRTVLIIKKCAARTNAELGQISNRKGQAIMSACDSLLNDYPDNDFPVSVYQTGSGTSSNMNVNEVIATLANSIDQNLSIHANDDVNYGQSSNDVIPSAVQLSLALLCHGQLIPALDRAITRLDGLSVRFHHTIKTGRTHLMDAMPISLGSEFATWAFQLREGKSRLSEGFKRLTMIPLGGTAVGTGVNCHPNYPDKVADKLSTELGLSVTSCQNKSARMAAMDPVTETHAQLKGLATTLIKIANDIRWMNSGPNQGLGEIQLAAIQPGSSIMPGKVNPVIAESIAMMATRVIGNDVTISVANQSGNFQLNVMLPLIADVSIESAGLIESCLEALSEKMFKDLHVNEQSLQQQVAKNPMLVTALNQYIGYENAAKIAKIAQSEDRDIVEVAKAETDIDEQKLRRLLDPIRIAFPFDKN